MPRSKKVFLTGWSLDEYDVDDRTTVIEIQTKTLLDTLEVMKLFDYDEHWFVPLRVNGVALWRVRYLGNEEEE